MSYRLRDWLFSRQRYWGEPFPIVYDRDGVAHALPESMLPVLLPEVDDYAPRAYDPDDLSSEPETPLSRQRDWVEVELDLGDGPQMYTRETNTMPNWAGSSWYELRYIDPAGERFAVAPGERGVLDGPVRRRSPRAVSTCTWAASSRPCCTCCTRGSGTRSCTISATSAPPSRSTD